MDIVVDGSVASVIMQENAGRQDFDLIIKKLESTAGLKEVCFDLKNLYYIKSETLAEFIGVKKWAGKNNIHTVLLNVGSSIYQVLEMTNLLSLFELRRNFASYTPEELISLFQDMDTANAASEYLASKYSDEARAALMNGLQHGDVLTQEYCVLTMGRAHDFASTETIQKALDSEYPGVVKSAILVLGWMGDVDCKNRFYSFISSEFDEISEAAGASISLLSDDSDPARLGKLAETGNANLRSVIAGTLAMINGDEAFDIIVNMLKNEKDDAVRKVLASRISFFNKPEATEILVALLDDKSQAVQEAAAAGLGRTGLGKHEQAVIKKISGNDSWIGYFAIKALGKHFSPESAKAMIDAYSNAKDNVKLAIVEAMGCSDLPETAAFLEARLQEQNDDIRKEALSSLAKFDAGKATQLARDLVIKDASWLVRYLAVEIILDHKPAGYVELLKKVATGDENKYIQEKVKAMIG